MSPLQTYREQIDKLDSEIVKLIAKRLEVVKNVGIYKKQNNIALLQPKRWDEVLQTKMKLAQEQGIDPNLVKDIYNIIHKYALEAEAKIEPIG